MKIRPLGAELLHTDGQTENDRYDEGKSLLEILRTCQKQSVVS